jgi:hypothetical protein
MTVTDRMRTDLHGCLDGLMGNEMADIMMELLPPVGWGEVVRRQDVAQMRSDLRSEIVGLRVGLKIEIAEVRAELKAGRRSQNCAPRFACLRARCSHWPMTSRD